MDIPRESVARRRNIRRAILGVFGLSAIVAATLGLSTLEPALPSIDRAIVVTDRVTHALSEVHLEIRKGEYVSIEGHSGSGKSTLLSILGLLDSPTEGSYHLNDRPVANLTASQRARIRNLEIGFIFQSFNLIGDLNVYENVELPLTYRGISGSECKQRVKEALPSLVMARRRQESWSTAPSARTTFSVCESPYSRVARFKRRTMQTARPLR